MPKKHEVKAVQEDPPKKVEPSTEKDQSVNVEDCEEVSLDSLNVIDDGNDALEKHIADDEMGDELDCEEPIIDD